MYEQHIIKKMGKSVRKKKLFSILLLASLLVFFKFYYLFFSIVDKQKWLNPLFGKILKKKKESFRYYSFPLLR